MRWPSARPAERRPPSRINRRHRDDNRSPLTANRTDSGGPIPSALHVPDALVRFLSWLRFSTTRVGALGTPAAVHGSRLPRHETTRIKEEHENLATYIRSELSDYISVLQSRENPTIIGAIPVDAKDHDTLDTDALLSRTLRRPGAVFPRFHPAFWTAFVKELEPETHRYISIGPPPRFRDFGSDAQPEDMMELSREYIVGTDDDVASVHESIKKWIRVNQLKEEVFLVEATMIPENLPSDDLLGRLVGALTQDELRRMSIPLDVVGKLRRRAI